MRKFLGVVGLLVMVGTLAACESAKSAAPAGSKPTQQAPAAGTSSTDDLGD